MDNFPKLQYSKFIGQDQIVVRSNDQKEFLDNIAFVEDFISKQPKNVPSVQTPSQALGVCSKCGADNKISKQGKIYCGATCWLKGTKTY